MFSIFDRKEKFVLIGFTILVIIFLFRDYLFSPGSESTALGIEVIISLAMIIFLAFGLLAGKEDSKKISVEISDEIKDALKNHELTNGKQNGNEVIEQINSFKSEIRKRFDETEILISGNKETTEKLEGNYLEINKKLNYIRELVGSKTDERHLYIDKIQSGDSVNRYTVETYDNGQGASKDTIKELQDEQIPEDVTAPGQELFPDKKDSGQQFDSVIDNKQSLRGDIKLGHVETEEEIIDKLYKNENLKKYTYPADISKWMINPKHGFKAEQKGNLLEIKASIEEGLTKYIFTGGKGRLTETPVEKEAYKIEEEKFYFVDIKCKTDKEIALWIIFYDEQNRIDKYNYQVKSGKTDNSSYFITPKGAKYFRFAIRFEGQVSVELDKIMLSPLDKTGLEPKLNEFTDYIPDLDGSEYAGDLKIACILDTFSFNCFKYDANLFPLTQTNWAEEIIEFKPDIFLCESAWHGNDGEWDKKVSEFDSDGELAKLINYCKKHGIKTIFWNKEDPPNYDVFINAAKNFDYIFTTDENCVPKYIEDAGHENCFPLPFAAQPVIHNPMKRSEIPGEPISFAGTWYGNKHEERLVDMKTVLDPAMAFGLSIYDRNFYRNANSMRFPINYLKFIRGSLQYDKMLSAYRSYKVFLNVNSVKESPTMFSRRVFELLACGTNVISTESVGISKIFDDLVKITNSESQTERHLENLLAFSPAQEKLAHLGYRFVMENHTYSVRINDILTKTGLGRLSKKRQKPLLSVITVISSQNAIENAIQNFTSQTYPNTEMILLLRGDEFEVREVRNKISKYPNIRASKLESSKSVAECINFGLSNCNGEYFALMNENDIYGNYYLSDLHLPFSYCYAPFVGKKQVSEVDFDGNLKTSDGLEHDYVTTVEAFTLLGKCSKLDEIEIVGVNNNEIELKPKETTRFYSADKFNYIKNRSGSNKEKLINNQQITEFILI
jgi:spore maturation protein CgeB